jgi:HSP20 family protein
MLVRWAEPRLATNGWREINRLFDETFGLAKGPMAVDAWIPAVNVSEDDKAYLIALEVPGVRPEDIAVELDANRLNIRGEKKAGSDNGDGTHRFERRFGSFQRSFTLPEVVSPEGITAKLEHGVLLVTVPKVELPKPKSVPIQVG